MFESTCNGFCKLWGAVDYTIGAGAYASAYIGGSIPSGIAKGVEGVASGCYKVSQLFAYTDESGNRHGLLYHPVSQAAGVVLAGAGISYAGYNLCKKEGSYIKKVLEDWWTKGKRPYIQPPSLNTAVRTIAGATMAVSGVVMILNTFYHGTWGVPATDPSYDHNDVAHSLVSHRGQLADTQAQLLSAQQEITNLRAQLAAAGVASSSCEQTLASTKELLDKCQPNLSECLTQKAKQEEFVKERSALLASQHKINGQLADKADASAKEAEKCAKTLADLRKKTLDQPKPASDQPKP